MADRWERLVSGILTAAAMVMAVSIAYRTLSDHGLRQGGGILTLDSIPSWRDAIQIGTRDGPPTAPVTIVELADLECPACRALQPTLADLRRKYPDKLAIVWVNYPLAYHHFALGAARAAECAETLGAFDRWRDEVFKEQDSLGLKSWGEMAAAAGIADTGMIGRCARDPAPVAAIMAGLKFGDEIGLVGTPTVILNGWRFSSAPTAGELKAAIDEELHGQRPSGSVHGKG